MIRNVNTKLPRTLPDFQRLDQNFKDLFYLLFDHDENIYSQVKSKQLSSPSHNSLDSSVKADPSPGVFHVASSGSVQDPSGNKLEKKPNNGVDEWWDDDFKRWFPQLDADELQCKNAQSEPSGPAVLAWTYNDRNSAQNQGQSYPTIIQICKWYYDKMTTVTFPERLKSWMLKVKGFEKLRGSLRGDKEIDAFTLLDVTLVHELTHTFRGGDLRPPMDPNVPNKRIPEDYGYKLLQDGFKITADGKVCKLRGTPRLLRTRDDDDDDLTCPPNEIERPSDDNAVKFFA
ncbi:MAG: hypothetical protein Q9227_005593 [Pyrenula ochraceoflavens]